MMASTSASNQGSGILSVSFSSLSRHRIWLFGIGAGIGLGLGIHLWYRLRGNSIKTNDQNSIILLAERKKAEGNESYKNKRYKEAIEIFDEVINSISSEKSTEAQIDLVATCQNNIAACYDAMLDPVRCIEYCTKAVQLKPDYVKNLMRRAKCLNQLGRYLEALEDYIGLLSLDRGSLHPNQISNIQNDMDNVIESIVMKEYEELQMKRAGQKQRVSQRMVEPWQFETSIHDPLLVRAKNLNQKVVGEGDLDVALLALMKGNYDDIVSLATKVFENELNGTLDRASGILLAARFLHYQGLTKEAMTMSEKFIHFWEQFDETQKLENKDLFVSHIVLVMTLGRPLSSIDFSGSVDETRALNETKIEELSRMAEQALEMSPDNVDPLVFLGQVLLCEGKLEDALEKFKRAQLLDEDHPFIRFYEIFANFILASRNANMADIHKHIREMERALKEKTKPPMFALNMLTKIGILIGNNEIALEAVHQAVQQNPDCSYVVYLSGVLENQPDEATNKELFDKYLERLEKTMHDAIKLDPNYWEPYGMLAKIELKKHHLSAAMELFKKALDLTTNKDEAKGMLKERLMLLVIEGRKNKLQKEATN